MDIILYSTGCPKCNILKKKLAEKSIPYIENNNVEEMTSLGIDYIPVLLVNGKMMQFKEANDWINQQ